MAREKPEFSVHVMMDTSYRLDLSKREFTLITKALCGKLSAHARGGDEVAEANRFGKELMAKSHDRLVEKLDASARARKQAGDE
jgi:hypothetical protein